MKISHLELQREVRCKVCNGNRIVCLTSVCPILTKAKALFNIEKAIDKTSFFGPSPPAIFVGQWGYPKVAAGPLVPSVMSEEPNIMDASEFWLGRTMEDLLRFRFSLVRGKSFVEVKSASNPSGVVQVLQEAVLSSKPTDTEILLKKKPNVRILLSARDAPTGPSGILEKAHLAQNPSVPRPVENIVSDTDLKANHAVKHLYSSGILQSQITRIFASGLLGIKSERKLVPTEWSITAIDDILGRTFHRQILQNPFINEFWLFGAKAFGNNVQTLLLPTPWMFEAMEAWMTTLNPTPDTDYEFTKGRKTYPRNILGAYHAARLPILEMLHSSRRQAGAIAFLEVTPEWIPLGVWRFRELCREALKQKPAKFPSLDEAISALSKRLQVPIRNWAQKSRFMKFYKTQQKIEQYLTG